MKHATPLMLAAFLAIIAMCAAPSAAAHAQDTPVQQHMHSDATALNPLAVIEDAARLLPINNTDAAGSQNAAPANAPLSTALNIILLLTVLALAPAILVLCTCFTRIVIVLSLLRQALGTQSVPPSQVIVGLSVFITAVIMAPTAQQMYAEGIGPYVRGEQTDYEAAWHHTKQPLRAFMFTQIEATDNWSGLYMMLNYRGIDTSDPQSLSRDDVDMLTLIPAYVLSELKVAFLIGFRVYLPFLVIDMVISSMLISMGMLMLPPVLISLPFKLLLFVLVDGWQLVVGSLMTSVVQPDLMSSTQQVLSFAFT